MRCYKCGFEHEDAINGRIDFRAVCEKCGHYLHSCYNCQFYKIGQPNDCMIPGTEPVRDRDHFNFCEEFKPGKNSEIHYKNTNEAVKKLFGETDENYESQSKDPKDRFNSLFND